MASRIKSGLVFAERVVDGFWAEILEQADM